MTIQKFEVPDWIRSVLICDPTDIWGNVVGMGLAELAAVLTPAKRFDRRGNIVSLDSFENGLAHWLKSEAASGGEIALTTSEVNFGGFACKITGGSTALDGSYITTRLPKPALSKIGVETHFRRGSNVDAVEVEVYYYDGTKAHRGSLWIDLVENKVQYLNSSGVWVDLQTAVSQPETANQFYIVKLVIDPATDLYTRALFYGAEKAMSSLALQTYNSATSPGLHVYLWVYSVAGSNGWCYLDTVIITQNEPA